MSWKRIGSALIALVLVCCLIVNISPIRAQALAAEAVAVIGVSAALVIGSVLVATGILPGTDSSVFEGCISSCQDFLTSAGYVVDGLINVYALTDHNYRYAVDEGLLDAIRGWSFESGFVTEIQASGSGVSVGTKVSYGSSGAWYSCTVPTVLLKASYTNNSGIERIQFVSYTVNTPFTYSVSPSGATYDATKRNIGEVTYYFTGFGFNRSSASQNDVAGTFYLGSGYVDGSFELIDAILIASDAVVPSISSNYDLVLGDVAASDVDTKVGYETWYTNGVEIETEGTGSGGSSDDGGNNGSSSKWLYPLGLAATIAEILNLTQDDAQSGDGTYEPEIEDPSETPEFPEGTFADTAVGSFLESLLEILWIPFKWLGELITSLWNTLSELFTNYIVEPILSGIKAIFVPSTDFLSTKVEALRSEFDFVDAIINTSDFFTVSLAGLGTEPPIIYIDLGAAEGSYNLGGKVVFMDLSWYERYKATGDAIISAFLWLIFVWRIILKLPGIISGMPGDWVMGAADRIGVTDHLPTRSMDYAAKRADLRDEVVFHRAIRDMRSGH